MTASCRVSCTLALASFAHSRIPSNCQLGSWWGNMDPVACFRALATCCSSAGAPKSLETAMTASSPIGDASLRGNNLRSAKMLCERTKATPSEWKLKGLKRSIRDSLLFPLPTCLWVRPERPDLDLESSWAGCCEARCACKSASPSAQGSPICPDTCMEQFRD